MPVVVHRTVVPCERMALVSSLHRSKPWGLSGVMKEKKSPHAGGTYHVNGTERTADAGSPSGCVRGLVEGRSQCIKRGGERGSQLDFVPKNCAIGGRKVAVPLSCPYFTEPGRVG